MGPDKRLLGHGDRRLDVHTHDPPAGDQQREARTEDADQCPRVQGGRLGGIRWETGGYKVGDWGV